MMVKYCNKCSGHPYTEDFSVSNCPVCNSELLFEMVSTESIANRPKLSPVKFNVATHEKTVFPVSSKSSGGFKQSGDNGLFPVRPTQEQKEAGTNTANLVSTTNSSSVPSTISVGGNNQGSVAPDARSGGTVFTGKVSQYSCTGKEDGNYRRLLITKIIDAVVYHQRLEDVLHRFNVRVENGKDAMGYSQYSDIPVNVHGTIASGMQITDNAEVEVEGKYRNGVLMASKVSVVNNGFNSQIKFQRSVSAIIYGVLAVVAAIALIVFVANTDGNFFANLKSFLLTWLVMSVVTAVLYLVLIFSKIGFLTRMATGKPKKFPIVGILLFSLIITMIFMNSFGIGASLSGLLSKLLVAIMPAAIIIIAIIFLIKLIFK